MNEFPFPISALPGPARHDPPLVLDGDTRTQTRRGRLAEAFDDAAVTIHRVARLKMTLVVVAGLVAATTLSWKVSAGWTAVMLVLEVWSWAATRVRGQGEPFTLRQRANFLVNYVTRNLWWLALSAVYWAQGTPVGHAVSVILVAAVIALLILLFYTAPAVFLLVGSAPAIAAVTLLGLGDGWTVREMLPIWAILGLACLFTLGRALEAPSAQEHKRRLSSTRGSYRILAENITEIMSRVSITGIQEYVSPACLAVLGYEPEEMIGKRRRDFIHPDCVGTVYAAVKRMRAGETTTETITSRVRHKDGHYLWIETRAKVLIENGVLVGYIDVSHDITERVAAEAALREAKSQAEAATLAKAEFLANISHEIRTPMNGVLGALHLLERENISPEGRELMRQAHDCGRMLSQLLNDVLDFSKIEAGQLELYPEPIHAGDALQAVCMLLAPQAKAKGLDLNCEIEGESLWIVADPVRLRQTMFNLVGNAVKFTERGHVTARLVAEPLPDGPEGPRRRLSLEVEDTGIGMSAQVQSHLFERFRQAEGAAARRFGGTGLGLTITQALARMMGGEIAFSSVEGEGSSFCLSFDAPAADPVSAVAAEDGLLQGVRVLLVEDNATNRLVARTMLTRLGAEVEEAEDGVTGLACARGGHHDLILMDIQMPHMDGVQCARAIRALGGAHLHTPILALTANVMVHQVTTYRAAGMNGAVAKPIAPAALLAEIGRVIAETETEAAA